MIRINKTLKEVIVKSSLVLVITIAIALLACASCEDPMHITGEENFENYSGVKASGIINTFIKSHTEVHNTLQDDWKDMLADGLINGTYYPANRMVVWLALGVADTFPCTGSVVDTHIQYFGGEVVSELSTGQALYLKCTTPRPGLSGWAYYSYGEALSHIYPGDYMTVTWKIYFQESGMPSGTFFTDTFFTNLCTGGASGSASFPRYHRYIYNNDDSTLSITSNYSDVAVYTTIFESTDTVRGLADDTLLEVQLLNTSLQIIWVDTVDKAITNGKSVRYKTKVQML